MVRVVVLTLSLLIASSIGSAQPLAGVWSLQEQEITSGPNSGTVTRQPGLLIFTGRHYSQALVTSQEPRPLLSDSPTDGERASVFGPYNSNAGTYERDGSTITVHVMVAKNPGRMVTGGDGNVVTREITELTEDTLEMTGPIPGGTVRYRFTRVE